MANSLDDGVLQEALHAIRISTQRIGLSRRFRKANESYCYLQTTLTQLGRTFKKVLLVTEVF